MDITDKDIAEFQKLYKDKFNKEIDRQTARKKLVLLVRQVEIVCTPLDNRPAALLNDDKLASST